MGHDFTGEGNIADLGYAARIHQENNVGTRAALQLRQGLGGIANVGNILLVADGFFCKVQNLFQQDLMELHNVKRLLTYGKAGKVLRGIGIGMVQQEDRLAVTASMLVPERPHSQSMVVARTASRGASTSSTSKKGRTELRKASSEKEGRLWTTRCVGRMRSAGLFMLTKVIMTNS